MEDPLKRFRGYKVVLVIEQKFQMASWKGMADKVKFKKVPNMSVQWNMNGEAGITGYIEEYLDKFHKLFFVKGLLFR